MSRRAGCRESGSSSSREASESNPRSPTGSNLQILSHALQSAANAGERETLCRATRQSRLIQMGEEVRQLPNPSAGIGPKPHMANRVQSPQVRLTHAGVGSLTVATPISRNLTRSGVLPRKADHEQLNDERGASPCQSATAETKPNREKPNQDG